MGDVIEMLTDDPSKPGQLFPADRGPCVKHFDPWPPPAGDDPARYDVSHAYLHTFFVRDQFGQPITETAVRFYVPERWLRDGQPTSRALEFAKQRILRLYRPREWAIAEKARRVALVRELLVDQSVKDDAIWETWKRLAKARPTSAFDVTRELSRDAAR